VEYKEEYNRGYDHREDLMVPGYFEVSIKKGETIIFSASVDEQKPRSLKALFEKELTSRLPLSSFENCLKDAANQFVVKAGRKYRVNAGYHWFANTWGRDTFISLPGLLLPEKDYTKYYAVLDYMTARMNGPLFANTETGNNASYNSADASLWFVWAVQQLAKSQRTTKYVWKRYGTKLKKVIDGYIKGTEYNIKMHENGLIWQGKEGLALTWMDAIVDGKPVTPRTGYAVEINALWYNAVMFVLEAAEKNGDKAFVNKVHHLPSKIKDSFLKVFWNKSKGYLADYSDGNNTDWSIRPNQVIAASMPYSPIDDYIKKDVLEIVERELLTFKGLRTF
jgi:predicted glycogen debranching enzyme